MSADSFKTNAERRMAKLGISSWYALSKHIISISLPSLYHYRDDRHVPSLVHAREIARALDCSVDELWPDSDEVAA